MSQPRNHGKFAATEGPYPDDTDRPGGEVMLAVHHLESLLDDLSTLVYSLRSQIEPVLTPEAALAVANDALPRQQHSPLAERVRGAQDTVSGLITAVRDMKDRVEL